ARRTRAESDAGRRRGARQPGRAHEPDDSRAPRHPGHRRRTGPPRGPAHSAEGEPRGDASHREWSGPAGRLPARDGAGRGVREDAGAGSTGRNQTTRDGGKTPADESFNGDERLQAWSAGDGLYDYSSLALQACRYPTRQPRYGGLTPYFSSPPAGLTSAWT